MEAKEIKGYGCVVTWDGETLRARGTNKTAHFALLAQQSALKDAKPQSDDEEPLTATEAYKLATDLPDELVLSKGEFVVDHLRKANMAVNGNLVLRTPDGVKYQLHFRRKHNADFEELAEALQS